MFSILGVCCGTILQLWTTIDYHWTQTKSQLMWPGRGSNLRSRVWKTVTLIYWIIGILIVLVLYLGKPFNFNNIKYITIHVWLFFSKWRQLFHSNNGRWRAFHARQRRGATRPHDAWPERGSRMRAYTSSWQRSARLVSGVWVRHWPLVPEGSCLDGVHFLVFMVQYTLLPNL